MAELTDSDYAMFQQIKAAFQGAMSIGQLPPLPDGTDPLSIMIEASYNNTPYRSNLAGFLPYTEDMLAYGIEWDTAVSSPACTRVCSLPLHKSLPLHNRMKGCLQADTGEINEYLPPSNWTASDRSGARGQVTVEIPPFYWKNEAEGTKRRFKMSEYRLPGYKYFPGAYIGAYKASMERSTGKLCSIINSGTDYRGGNNQADWDGTNKSQLGMPVTMKSRTQFRTAARLRGAGWEANPYALAYWAYVWLARVEYANLNCQLPVNNDKDANGFAQGGLGNGITTLSSVEWNAFNAYYPLVPCGTTDSLGNSSGEVACNLLNADGTVFKTVMANRYRGIENPFGDLWEWSDGIDVDILTDADGGTSKLYVCTKPSLFTDSGGYANYQMRGILPRAEGYVKEIIFVEYADLLPTAVGAGSTTYFCDYFYTNITSTTRRGVLFGGAAHYGANAGFGSASSRYAPSHTSADIGSRLCFIPVQA